MQRSELEHLALRLGYTVQERQQETYYPALGRSERTITFVVLDGDRQLALFSEHNLALTDASLVTKRLTAGGHL